MLVRRSDEFIKTKRDKVMIFDTGIKSELLDWAKNLPGIRDEPSASIGGFSVRRGSRRLT